MFRGFAGSFFALGAKITHAVPAAKKLRAKCERGTHFARI